MKEKLKKVWKKNRIGLCVMAVAWLGFFWRMLFLGQIIFTGDIKLVFYPLEHVYGIFQRAGQLPLWSSLFGFGHPLLSWGQLGFFTPLHMFLRQFNMHALEIINVSMMIHFALGLLGLYVFLRRRKASQIASALAAIVFVFNGYNVSHIVHLNFFVVVMLMPWLLVAIDVFVKKVRIWTATLLGVVAGIIVLSGHAQIVLYCLILSAIVGLFIVKKYSKRLVLGVVLAAIVGMTLSSLAWLPLIEFLPYIDRTEGMTTQELYNFSYPPWHSITLIFPTFFGEGDGYWGASSHLELGAFLGIIPLLLAGAGIASDKNKFKKEKRLAITALLIGSIVSLGKYFPIYRLLVENGLFPPFTAPGRWLIFFVFGIAILSAIGIDALISHWEKKRGRELIGAIVLVLILLSSVLAIEYKVKLEINRFELLAAISGVMVFALAWILPRKEVFKKLWVAGCIGLTMLTIIVFGWRLYPLTDREIAFTPSSFAEEVASYQKEFGLPARVYSDNVLLRKSSDESPEVEQMKRTDRLAKDFSVHQEITAERDDLACFRMAIESNKTGEDKINIELSEIDTNNIVRQVLIPAQDITDAGYQRFCFDPINDSAGKKYIISFSTQGEGGSVVLFYRPSQDKNRQAYFVRVQYPTAEQFEKSRKELTLVMELEYGKEIDLDQALIMRHFNATAQASGARWIGSLSIRRYRDFVKQLFDNDRATIDGDGKHVLARNRQIFNLAGVTHFIQVLEEGATDGMTESGFTLLDEDIVRENKYRLYSNDQAMPRAFTVSRGIIKDDRKETFSAMTKPEFDPRQTVYLEDFDTSLQGDDLPVSNQHNSDVKIINYESTRVDIRVKTDNQTWLVLTDSFTPLWQVYIDGKKAPRFVAYQLFRAVSVPAGEHVISWQYESRATRLAKWLTGLSLIFTLIVLAKSLISMRHLLHYENKI